MAFVQSRKSLVTVVSYVCPGLLLSAGVGSLQTSKVVMDFTFIREEACK